PAELGLHRLLGVGADFEGKGSLLEFRNHTALAEVAEVAALGSSAVLGLLLGDGLKVATSVELGDDRLGLFLGADDDVAGADRVVRHRLCDVLLDVGAVQRAVAQHRHAALELVGLGEAGTFGLVGHQADLDDRRESGSAALLGRKLSELLLEVSHRDLQVGLGDRLTIDGCHDCIGRRVGRLVSLRSRRSSESEHGGCNTDADDRQAAEGVNHSGVSSMGSAGTDVDPSNQPKCGDFPLAGLGSRSVDIACGPSYLSFHLASRRVFTGAIPVSRPARHIDSGLGRVTPWRSVLKGPLMVSFGSLARKIFGSSNDRRIKGFRPRVEAINALEKEMEALSDEALRAKTDEFRQEIAAGKSLDDLLIPAFAVAREAARRALGLRPFDVQLIGGMVLHGGGISEMRTGEGKTLVATLPVYLNALSGKGVHVVTVNDYLASRDAEWMGRVYGFLGLTTGVIVHGLSDEERKDAYACDITYATNNELGFDYLRDNMKYDRAQMVQRGHNYAIVDEVDSILIDEARTPLIISGPLDDRS